MERRAEQGPAAAEVTERTARGQVNEVRRRSSRSLWAVVRANVLTLFNAVIAVSVSAIATSLNIPGEVGDALTAIGGAVAPAALTAVFATVRPAGNSRGHNGATDTLRS